MSSRLSRVATAIALSGLCSWSCADRDSGIDLGLAAPGAIDLGPGVSASLAEHRAASVSDLSYEIFLDIPEFREERILGRLIARFSTSSDVEPLVLDFAHGADRVASVLADGRPVPFEVRDQHIIVGQGSVGVGDQEIEIAFEAGEGSLNRNEEFLYTLFVPDRARVAMPLFDQPDLKARIRLTLELPSTWHAIANGALEHREEAGGRATSTFAWTEPISTYLIAFAAGRFEVVEAERNGRALRMFHRESDADKVARNIEAIFDLHAAALAWLEEYTGIPYPFAKLDFALIPAFQYGGMEHTGSIFYRDRSLFLDPSATQNQVLGRASLIAHEVAHMWFGNLVTMEWFNDVWMKEVFANFMAAKIVNPSFPEVDHDLRFLLAHYPAAYAVDRTAGANPIRQELENLAEAGSLYGSIIYQKAPIVMKHLELLLGEGTFRDGLREYLEAHRYDNATWTDLIDILDRLTPDDLASWSRIWVEQAGRPTIATTVTASEDGSPATVRISQSDPDDLGRLWFQPLQVRLESSGTGASVLLQMRAESLEVQGIERLGVEGLDAPDFVLANGAGIGYGNFVLDAASRRYLSARLPEVPRSMTRAVAWLSLWDTMLEGGLGADELVDLALRALPRESDELNTQRVLSYLREAYWRFLTPAARLRMAPRVEEVLWREVTTSEGSSLKSAYFGTYRDVALGDAALARLRRIWDGSETIEGLELSESDTTTLAQQLAVRGVSDAEAVLDRQLERIANPDRADRFVFVRPALSADVTTRDEFFAGLAPAEGREREPWVLEALRLLHHPLRAAESERYIRPSLDLLEEIQRTGDIFFPLGWLDATLSGHSSPTAAAIVEGFLEERSDLPPRLRGKLLQAADPLFRAARLDDRRSQ